VIRVGRALLLAMLVIGCSASLSDGAWVWCQANASAVADAAGTLGIHRTTFKFWAIEGGSGDLNAPVLRTDPDFVRACTLAHSGTASSGALSDADWAWCSDGANTSTVLDASDKLGIAHVQAAFGALPWEETSKSGDQLRSDGDYSRACNAAFAASH